MAIVSLFSKRFLPGSGFCGQPDIVSSPAMFTTREWQAAVEDGGFPANLSISQLEVIARPMNSKNGFRLLPLRKSHGWALTIS